MKKKGQSSFSGLISLFKTLFQLMPYFVLTAVLVVSFDYLKNKEFDTVLPIESVTVEGVFQHLGRSEIEQVVLNTVEGGFFTLKLDEARKRLLQKPWVKSVSVRRRWPAELIVSVEEKRAVAYWNKQSFISESGDVFSPRPMPSAMILPKMFGPKGQHEKVWLFMNEIYQPLASLELNVASLYLDERRAWTISLEATSLKSLAGNNLLVNLGRYDTKQRFERFVRVFSKLASLGLNDFKAMDMRYPNGFSVLKKTQKTVLKNKYKTFSKNIFKTVEKNDFLTAFDTKTKRFLQYNMSLLTGAKGSRSRDLIS